MSEPVSERRVIPSTLASSHGAASNEYRPVAVMPDVRVVKIGGQSIMDRGRAALFPILDEVIEARKKGIQVVLLTGGGTRAFGTLHYDYAWAMGGLAMSF